MTAVHSIGSTTESSPHGPSLHLDHHAKAHSFPQTQALCVPTACRQPQNQHLERVSHHANSNLIPTSLQPYLLPVSPAVHHCYLLLLVFFLSHLYRQALSAARHPSTCTKLPSAASAQHPALTSVLQAWCSPPQPIRDSRPNITIIRCTHRQTSKVEFLSDTPPRCKWNEER